MIIEGFVAMETRSLYTKLGAKLRLIHLKNLSWMMKRINKS